MLDKSTERAEVVRGLRQLADEIEANESGFPRRLTIFDYNLADLTKARQVAGKFLATSDGEFDLDTEISHDRLTRKFAGLEVTLWLPQGTLSLNRQAIVETRVGLEPEAILALCEASQS